jgi:hypothetical protein
LHLIYSKLYSGSAVADFLYYDQIVNILCDSTVTMDGELPSVNKLLFPNQSPATPNDTAWLKCCLSEVIVGKSTTGTIIFTYPDVWDNAISGLIFDDGALITHTPSVAYYAPSTGGYSWGIHDGGGGIRVLFMNDPIGGVEYSLLTATGKAAGLATSNNIKIKLNYRKSTASNFTYRIFAIEPGASQELGTGTIELPIQVGDYNTAPIEITIPITVTSLHPDLHISVLNDSLVESANIQKVTVTIA